MRPTAFLTAAALLASHAAADEYFQGDITTYTLGQPSAGNCNFMASAPAAATNYAAMNTPQWADSKNCGRCAEVSCSDSRCADQSKTEIVYILDRCPECQHGDLDVSPSVFKSLTGSDPSRYKIKWRFVDCPVSGNVQYCLKGGSNPFWTAIQPANVVAGVTSMTINGQSTGMVTSAYYYLLDGRSATQTDLGSVKVSMTSVSGEVIEDTVSLTAGSCTEGKHQFATGRTPIATPGPAPTTAAPVATPAPPTATTVAPVTKTPAPNATTKPPSAAQNSTSQAVNEAGVVTSKDNGSVDMAPGRVTSQNDNAPALIGGVSEDQISAALESGVASTETPSPTSDSKKDDDAQQTGGVNEVNTRSDGGTGTSSTVIVLIVLAAVGMVALAVMATVVKRKKLMDKEADRDESSLGIVNLGESSSFDASVSSGSNTVRDTRSARGDFAVL
ncbi:hypothetical protein Poli38472_007348 [Pythium oligandrum]|uniref:Expansin-like EG45 domain-containing protein n=1 Tax=Pythium oligandrum TaxID=41045 RepID=A0A8K1FHX9_PYTOL|nr:hypothetical protein Poli38472_007348 [Pythium oligandrum]|eukprot:TMW59203.1 hypothetical protein Poli38472_007348 [Pythium oligandrum]